MNKKLNLIFALIIFILFTVLILYAKSSIHSHNFSYFKSDTTVVWIAPKSANKMKNPLKGKSEAANKGESLYIQNCSECHGTSGKGDGPTADMLDTKPANLTSKRVQKQSDGAIFWKISNGKGVMAAYKDALTEEQRWQLVNHIRKLKASK